MCASSETAGRALELEWDHEIPSQSSLDAAIGVHHRHLEPGEFEWRNLSLALSNTPAGIGVKPAKAIDEQGDCSNMTDAPVLEGVPERLDIPRIEFSHERHILVGIV